MAIAAPAELRSRLEAASRLYHRLVLIVGPSGSGKTEALQGLAQEVGAPVTNVNRVVSEQLLEVPRRRRPRELRSIVDRCLGAGDPVLLDNMEMLFDPDLQQDPLRLLEQLARNRTIAACWNGELRDGELTYAEPGHREGRAYPQPGHIIFDAVAGAFVPEEPARPRGSA